MEEECLFFVAVSRARTYLQFYQSAYPMAKGATRQAPDDRARRGESRRYGLTADAPLPPDAPRPHQKSLTRPTGRCSIGALSFTRIARAASSIRMCWARPAPQGNSLRAHACLPL